MTSLKSILLGSVAAVSLAAMPALAQSSETTSETEQTETEVMAQASGLPQSLQDVADQPVADLVGIDVLSEDGETVGQIDNFALTNDAVVAIVGVGGFLDLGDKDVGIPLSNMEYDAEQNAMMLSGVSEDQLRDMPAFDETMGEELASDSTLNDAQGDAGETETAAATDAEAEQPMDGESGTETAGADTETMTDGEGETETAAAADTETMAEGEGETETAEADTETMTEGEGETETAAATDTEAEQPVDGEGATETADAETQPMTEGEGETETAQAETDATMDNEDASETALTERDSMWTDDMESEFGQMADTQVAELIGMDVTGADGEVIGEVDNFAIMDNQLVAIVGIGGFLGLGEHNVALGLGTLDYDGEALSVANYSEEELRELPEYTEGAGTYLTADSTMRENIEQSQQSN